MDKTKMKTAEEILKRKENKKNGSLSYWQEGWVLEAMEEYASQAVEEYKEKLRELLMDAHRAGQDYEKEGCILHYDEHGYAENIINQLDK